MEEETSIPVEDHRGPSLWRLLWPALLPVVLAVIFFAVAPSWLNRRLQKNALERPANQTAERIEAIQRLDYEAIGNGDNPRQLQIRQALQARGIPRRFANLRIGLGVSLGLLALMGGTLLWMHQLQRQAAESNADLIRNYRRGWNLAIGMGVVNLVLLTPLIVYGIDQFARLLVGRPSGWLEMAAASGGVMSLWRCGWILARRVPLESDERFVRKVTPEECPKLWAVVKECAAKLGTTPPDNLLIGIQPTFYVSEFLIRFGENQSVQGRTLFLSASMLRQLNAEEVVAVIGHELGHFIGADTQLTREFYPLRYKALQTADALGNGKWWTRSSFQLALIFLWNFGHVERRVSRARELRADLKSAELASKEIAARSLVRIHVLVDAFNRRISDAIRGEETGMLHAPLSEYVSRRLAEENQFWTGLLQARMAHPLDSHPTLHERLTALGSSFTRDQALEAASTPIVSAWDSWMGECDSILAEVEKEFDEFFVGLRKQTQLDSADASTEEGRLTLETHFPEVVFQTRWGHSIFAGLAVVLFSVPLILVFVELPIPSKEWFGSILGLALLGFGIFVAYKSKRGVLRLHSGGLACSGWNRELSFQEVEHMNASTSFGAVTLRAHLGKRQRPFPRFPLLPIPRRTVSISISRYRGEAPKIVEQVYRYYLRRAE